MVGLGFLATLFITSVSCSAAARDEDPQDKPALCDESIVAATCAVFNLFTPSDVETAADMQDMQSTSVSTLTLSDFFFVQDTKVEKFLKDYLGFDGGNATVGCSDLCAAIVNKIPDLDRPDTSDTACFVHPLDHTSNCDVDVSVKGLQDIHFKSNTDIPKLKRKSLNKILEETPQSLNMAYTAEARKGFGTMTNMQLFIAIANAFHIFPHASTLGFHSKIGAVEDNSEEGCIKSQCTLNSHCYDRLEYCNMCQMCGGTKEDGSSKASSFNLDKELQALRTGAISQAFVAQAIRAMNSAHGKKLVKTWFGASTIPVRQELMKILLGVNDVLANEKYIKVSQNCRSNRYAYVEPERKGDLSRKSTKFKNKYGQYLVFLCNKFYDSSTGVQLETLLHEGSHHWPVAREDMCINGNENDFATKQKKCSGMAYGREECLKLPKTSWKKAIMNADNIAYFVNDVFKYTSISDE